MLHEFVPFSKLGFFSPTTVTFSVGTSTMPPPISGLMVASVLTLARGGSIGQDVRVDATSVTCFAYVASVAGPMDGALAIWNFSTEKATATPFKIETPFAWQPVVNSADLGGNTDVRVEIYVNTPGSALLIDNVNLF